MAGNPSTDRAWGIEIVREMFPKASAVNIAKYFPIIDQALDQQIQKHGIKDSGSILKLKLYSYATIRVENASFNPRDEARSRFNTGPQRRPKIQGLSANFENMQEISDKLITTYHLDRPFGLYDDDLRSKNNSLGNYREGMGELYKGRGFIQLTGRSNYVRYAALAGAPQIVSHPEKAGEPHIAARILAAYILHSCHRILSDLDRGDFRAARAVVNGPRALHHERFTEAYKKGEHAMKAAHPRTVKSAT